jgi:hypothetical protein
MKRPGSKPPEPQPAKLSAQDMQAAIPRIDRRIADIDAFDVNSVTERTDPRIGALSGKLDALLVSIFGPGTIEYDRHRWHVTELDTAHHMIGGIPIWEVREGLVRGLATAKTQLVARFNQFERI